VAEELIVWQYFEISMDQKVENLDFDDLARVEEQRSWVRDHFTPEARHKYNNAQEKLRLIDTILKEKWILPEETYKLLCLGIVLGDVLVQELGLKWVAVEDECGRTPSLILEGTTIIVFPLTMISKRIERGEDIDVYSLVDDTHKTVSKLKQEQT
jgi:hypothetical protein